MWTCTNTHQSQLWVIHVVCLAVKTTKRDLSNGWLGKVPRLARSRRNILEIEESLRLLKFEFCEMNELVMYYVGGSLFPHGKTWISEIRQNSLSPAHLSYPLLCPNTISIIAKLKFPRLKVDQNNSNVHLRMWNFDKLDFTDSLWNPDRATHVLTFTVYTQWISKRYNRSSLSHYRF